ncbi:hypothetical protein [Patulibacter sp. SYSU D01012]|uniref:hypothetical protein n=1 Tax=Patulibacter sp. SYSU D01012 TaxID=2817381 RepID=UPI001B314B6B|nr:hypothetical protein [Patulibacter sp. SYSU D01012]
MLPLRGVPVLLAVGVLSLPAVAAAAPPAAAPASPEPASAPFTPRAYPAFGRATTHLRIDRQRRVRLTARATRRYRRTTTIDATCTRTSQGSLIQTSTGVSTAVRPGARIDLPRGFDACTVSVDIVRRTRSGTSTTRKDVGAVALTAKGLEALRRQQLAGLIVLGHTLLGGDFGPMTPERAAKALGHARILKRQMSAQVLATPDAPLPPNAVGVWRQGRHVAVAATAPNGERLYLDHDAATRETRTNILEDLNSLGTE